MVMYSFAPSMGLGADRDTFRGHGHKRAEIMPQLFKRGNGSAIRILVIFVAAHEERNRPGGYLTPITEISQQDAANHPRKVVRVKATQVDRLASQVLQLPSPDGKRISKRGPLIPQQRV